MDLDVMGDSQAPKGRSTAVADRLEVPRKEAILVLLGRKARDEDAISRELNRVLRMEDAVY
jgi:hypothetical protein